MIEVLYHGWNSFPTFERTRGVPRLLSPVIYALKESSRPYITLSDFDIANHKIGHELIKCNGSEFDSIKAADITDKDTGSKKVEASMGNANQGSHIGTRAATDIFPPLILRGAGNGCVHPLEKHDNFLRPLKGSG